MKKLKHKVGAAEASLITGFISLDRFVKFLIQEGGIYAVIGIGLADSARAAMYWWNVHKKREEGDSSAKIYANLVFYTFKAAASITGVGLVYAGMILAGFGAIILGGMVATLRHGAKALSHTYSWLHATDIEKQEKSKDKAKSNALKALLGAMIVTGFVLYAFFPELVLLSTIPLKDMGYGLVIAATSYILYSFAKAFLMEKMQGYTKLENVGSSVADVSFVSSESTNGQTSIPGQGGTLNLSLTNNSMNNQNNLTTNDNNEKLKI